MAETVERDVEIDDLIVDPGLVAFLRAGANHLFRRSVDGDLVNALADASREPTGDVEAVERDDPAHVGIDPEQLGIVARLGHGEQTAGIGAEQHFRRQLECRVAHFERPRSSSSQVTS